MNHHSSVMNLLLFYMPGRVACRMRSPPRSSISCRATAATRGTSPATSWALVLASRGFMVLYGCIHWVLLPPWDPTQQRYVPRSGHSPFGYTEFADQILTYIAIVVAAHASAYLKRFAWWSVLFDAWAEDYRLREL